MTSFLGISRESAAGLRPVWAEPRPGWLLLWPPLLLVALDRSPDPASAMIRLALVLLLGTAAWAAGRGPAGPWAESGFAALQLLAWFGLCGAAFRMLELPPSVGGRLAVSAALLLGPVSLLWAWRRRAGLVPVVDVAAAAGGGSGAAMVRLLALVATLLALDRLLGLGRSDLLVAGTALALYAACRVRGRRPGLGALG